MENVHYELYLSQVQIGAACRGFPRWNVHSVCQWNRATVWSLARLSPGSD